MKIQTGFPQTAIEQLGYYVYYLLDPANDEIFYVGKGTGNRVFAHLNDSLDDHRASDKLERIREIHRRGDEVRHIILRHGLTEKEAFEVEATIIDYLGIEGLTNVVLGQDSRLRGKKTIKDIIALYASRKIDIREPSLLITVNKLFRHGISPAELYEITRGNWVLGERRKNVQYAFSVYRGVVREVYKVHKWFPVVARSVQQKTRNRWRFDGEVAENLSHYVLGDVRHYITRGNQNPIKYINC